MVININTYILRFNQVVYEMQTTEALNIPVALQRIFHNLQSSDTIVSTEVLIEALGWDADKSLKPKDVQGFIQFLRS